LIAFACRYTSARVDLPEFERRIGYTFQKRDLTRTRRRRRNARGHPAARAVITVLGQVPEHEVEHHLSHVQHELPVGHAVARLRIEHQLELLARLLQIVGELHRVLHVHVVVQRSVDEEKVCPWDSMDIRSGPSQRRGNVFWWCHPSLRWVRWRSSRLMDEIPCSYRQQMDRCSLMNQVFSRLWNLGNAARHYLVRIEPFDLVLGPAPGSPARA